MSERDSSARRTRLCLLSASCAFAAGLLLGVLLPVLRLHPPPLAEAHHPVRFLARDSAAVVDGVYWGAEVERALPRGFTDAEHRQWSEYLRTAVGVKLESGCGRMQNRLITFEDGTQGCVRYRQNTDQIQGELFSFYLARVLGLSNLAPSATSVVSLEEPLWRNLAGEISSAQWHSNRPVVVTRFIPRLEQASIPGAFRPAERHLNRLDVGNATGTASLVELAQWSDLIVFDYLTANLDRVVNNLYNYQWNANIMEAPAHNLARKGGLLVFLDNESGLLHGYRLLKKYEVYHSLLLDNLCVFRRQTVEAIRGLREAGDVGEVIRGMFERGNGAKVRDVLPTLPDKSVKILKERIGRVYEQVAKCEVKFGDRTV